MQAYTQKIGDLYHVMLVGVSLKSYSAKINATRHAEAINMAINNPPGLNQHPSRNAH